MPLRNLLARWIPALGILPVVACHDPCFLVVGCHDIARVAVEGRIVTDAGLSVPGTAVTLLVSTSEGIDSAGAVSDSRGLFSLAVTMRSMAPDSVALRVRPPGRPGYLSSPLDCGPVTKWGDACVLDPIVSEPSFPLYRFVYRNDVQRPAKNVRVVFRRTSGARLLGALTGDSVVTMTDSEGFARLFGPGVYADSLGAVIGELKVGLPAPIGTTIRQNYRARADARFNSAHLTVQPVGPTLEYLMVFADSVTGRRVAGVEMRFNRRSGISTTSESTLFVSNDDGLAFLTLRPLEQGVVIGDFSLTPAGSGLTTTLNTVALNTFDADSSIVLARWKVGVTGRLYPVAPP